MVDYDDGRYKLGVILKNGLFAVCILCAAVFIVVGACFAVRRVVFVDGIQRICLGTPRRTYVTLKRMTSMINFDRSGKLGMVRMRTGLPPLVHHVVCPSGIWGKYTSVDVSAWVNTADVVRGAARAVGARR